MNYQSVLRNELKDAREDQENQLEIIKGHISGSKRDTECSIQNETSNPIHKINLTLCKNITHTPT